MATPGFAAEQPPDRKTDLETAKSLFNQGQVHHSLGKYDQAISQVPKARDAYFNW